MSVRPASEEPTSPPVWLPPAEKSVRVSHTNDREFPEARTIERPPFSRISTETPLELTEFLADDRIGDIPAFPNPFRHPFQAVGWFVRLLFGIVSLVVLLAIVAAIPLVNFLALGYLLETEARLARTGRLRFMFPLLDLAPKLGSLTLGIWLWLIPIRLLSNASVDAMLINPEGHSARQLAMLANFAAGIVAIHLCLSLARGGGWAFFRPIKNLLWIRYGLRQPEYWKRADESIRQGFRSLRLKHHLWLGLRGFAGSVLWLWPPTLLFAALQRSDRPGQIILTLLGAAILIPVLAWVPFLQARFAAENRFWAMFELRAVRELFRRAPIAWLISLVFTYALTLPLYLFKIYSPPRDLLWGITLVFIVSIYPARVFAGWAYHRAWKRSKPAWFGFTWMARLLLLPLLAAYLFLLFFTPFIGEHGRAVLYEHHALLLPVPF